MAIASLVAIPLLSFAINSPPPHNLFHTTEFPYLPQETGFRRIHSPQRVLQRIGGLALIPNSTLSPVRSGASTVLMGFDVQTRDGCRWSARMISSRRDECDLFLMDSETLQRKAMAKIKVVPYADGAGHSISASLTLFDASILLWRIGFTVPWTAMLWQCRRKEALHRRELSLHRTYVRMILSPRAERK